MDQHGCVWLEARLKELFASHDDARPAFNHEYNWVFIELQGHMFKMACNAYGNLVRPDSEYAWKFTDHLLFDA